MDTKSNEIHRKLSLQPQTLQINIIAVAIDDLLVLSAELCNKDKVLFIY